MEKTDIKKKKKSVRQVDWCPPELRFSLKYRWAATEVLPATTVLRKLYENWDFGEIKMIKRLQERVRQEGM